MKIIYPFVVFALSFVLLIGSSGNFREYGGDRDAFLQIAGNESAYIAFDCPETVIVVENGETFEVMTLINNLPEMADFYIESQGNFILFSNPATIESGQSATIYGTFNGTTGDYTIQITVNAVWNNGSAIIGSCPIQISDPTVEIEKILVKGNSTVEKGVKEEWTFRITLNNYGIGKTYTVTDTIPAEFEVMNVFTSNGNYTMTKSGKGKMGAEKLTWVVTVENSEYIDVTISTKQNPAGKQEFTSTGMYILNEGAEIIGYGIKSNSLMIEVKDGGG